MRRILLFPLVLILLLFSWTAPVLAEDDQEDRLEETLEALKETSSGLSLIKAATLLGGLRSGSQAILKISGTVGKVNSGLSVGVDALDELQGVDVDDEDEVEDSRSLLQKLNDALSSYSVSDLRDDLQDLEGDIEDIELGTPECPNNSSDKVSFDLLVSDPEEAHRRLTVIGHCHHEAILGLIETEGHLREIAEMAEVTGRALHEFQKGLQELLEKGFPDVQNILKFSWWDTENLERDVAGVRNAAQKKLKRLQRLIEDQQRGYDAYRTNVKTFWDIALPQDF